MKDLRKETITIQQLVMTRFPALTHKAKIRKSLEPKKSVGGMVMASLIFDLESKVLLRMVVTIQELGFEVGVLIHDGLAVYEA